MLDRNLDIRCAWCIKISKLGAWNDNTYAHCTNREMKRAFLSLTDKKAFLKNSNKFYMCPLCEKWSRGSQLRIVNTEDKTLIKLGGEPVTKSVNNKNST